VTPRRAFWEAFATVCLPSVVVWSILAYLLRSKFSPYGEVLPIYLFLAVLPMPLFFPIYRRYLKGTPPSTSVGSPRFRIAMAILCVFIATVQASRIPALLRGHGNRWDLVFHVALAAIWLLMSIDYFRRGIGKQASPPAA
jgi:hypothetical protein